MDMTTEIKTLLNDTENVCDGELDLYGEEWEYYKSHKDSQPEDYSWYEESLQNCPF